MICYQCQNILNLDSSKSDSLIEGTSVVCLKVEGAKNLRVLYHQRVVL